MGSELKAVFNKLEGRWCHHPTRWARNTIYIPLCKSQLPCHHPTRWARNHTHKNYTPDLNRVTIPHGGLGTGSRRRVLPPSEGSSPSHTVGSEPATFPCVYQKRNSSPSHTVGSEQRCVQIHWWLCMVTIPHGGLGTLATADSFLLSKSCHHPTRWARNPTRKQRGRSVAL